ncbi:hypothetical protein [Pseudoalteromonas marina]|uniref:DUF2726 domain-containing protein n=1 Tax=Pseudoalteromonas marina TaxID=267375 RepID=A0ABT9FGD2_9GAMM|nr:hypothetical protein [Pseudoalteromonas marina]MDP2565845.1 hypothetical protein [Pseudoalteromonas marina]
MAADLITTLIVTTIAFLFFIYNKYKKKQLDKIKRKIKLSGIVALWDTTTIDIPDPAIIRNEMCRELYFASGINDRPCIDTVKRITGVENTKEYNFSTNIKTSIKLNLLFAIATIEQQHKDNCELHIFTKCPQLKQRIIYQANANNIKKLFFYGVDEK